MHDRVNDDKEWALGDLEKMCQLWHISPEQLIATAPDASAPSRAELAATAARGAEPIDIDTWADRIKAEENVHDPR